MTLLFSLLASPAFAKPPPPECQFPPDFPVTTPAKVDFPQLMKDLSQLTTSEGDLLVKPEDLRTELGELFDPNNSNSKLTQFYRSLYLIAAHTAIDLENGIFLSVEPARQLLLTAKVFPNLEFPKKIRKIWLQKKKGKDIFYRVTFDSSDMTHLPLNRGEGFKSWEDNFCQHAQALVFYSDFSFSLKMLPNGNLRVYDFDHVDLFGVFGTRGVIDVTLNYVQLDSVEFYKNSLFGKVKAYISRREFDANKHTWILKTVGRIVPNVSVTAIDW